MSVKVLTYVLENSAQRGNELLTMIVLADHADENGICWPSMERVGKLIRADERTARRCIRRLEEAGELRVQKGRGRGNANRYQIAMQKSLDLFSEKGGEMPPDNLPPKEKGAKRALKPDTAVSAEPSVTKDSKSVAGQAKASPVATCFQAYQQGIKRRYGADYPPSASANGILAKLVARLGAEPALKVTEAYLRDDKGYYVACTHKLEILAKDGPSIWVQIQRAVSGAGRPRCDYCGQLAVGQTSGIKHCRAHTNDALDGKRAVAA